MKYLNSAKLAFVFLLLLFIACDKQRTREDDFAKLADMKQTILIVAGAASANDSTDCRYVGLGSKPCGGPWEYLVYSIVDTDTLLLLELVGKYNTFEDELNRKYGRVSDCSITPPPVVGLVNGRCVDLKGIEKAVLK